MRTSLRLSIAFVSAAGSMLEPHLQTAAHAFTCAAGCGGTLASATLPGPSGPTVLTAFSNSPSLGTDYDCDPTPCTISGITAQNGQTAYGCAWQCVELVNRYLETVWHDPGIAANAGASFCQRAASSSLPQYWVYGSYGASTAGHAPIAGDVLVWSSHVAIATNSTAPGAAGTLDIIEENATCSGTDTVSWNGSMFGGKYGLAPLCWVHVVANTGVTNDPCSSAHYGSGDYCGGALTGADANTLYSCSGGRTAASRHCACGCMIEMARVNDICAACPSAPSDMAHAPTDGGHVSDGGPPPEAGSHLDGGSRSDAARGPADSLAVGVHGGCSAAPGAEGSGLGVCLFLLFAVLTYRARRWNAESNRSRSTKAIAAGRKTTTTTRIRSSQ